MNTKKILTIMIMASMLLGAIPAGHSATTFISLFPIQPPSGPVGTTFTAVIETGIPDTAFNLCYSSTDLSTPTTPCDSSTIIFSGVTNSTVTPTGTVGFNTTKLTVPPSVGGAHTLVAVEQSNAAIQATRPFTVIPEIMLSSSNLAVNDAFQVSGTGFAGTSGVTVNRDMGPISGCVSLPSGQPPVATNQFGSFRAQCRVPETPFTIPDGTHEIEAVDASGNTASQNFLLVPSVQITPTSGHVGVGADTDAGTTLTPKSPAVTVTVNALGFLPSVSLTVCFNRAGPFASCNTGKTSILGSFSYMFPTPKIPAGQFVFDANQTLTTVTPAFTVSGIRTATFTVVSDLDLNPDHGKFAPGPTDITASGTGFAADSSVSVTLNEFPTPNLGVCSVAKSGSTVVTLSRGTTLSDGSFGLSFSTPSVQAGLYQVNAIDAQGNGACADFAIGIFLRISPGTPNEGKVGDTANIQGYSFSPSSTVSITMTSTESTATRFCDGITATFTTDAQGDFGTTTSNGAPAHFAIPNCNRGDYIITARDSKGLFGTAPYRVFPWIDISPKAASVGNTVTVTGTGFDSSTNVDILYFGANAAMDQPATRTPVGFNAGNSRVIWSGAIPQGISSFSTGMGLSDLTGVWQIETVGGEVIVAVATSGQLGNFVKTFNVPESWGGFHPVYARESATSTTPAVPCGPDGTGPVVKVAVLCGQAFRNQPTISATPQDPKAGESMTITGTGFMWWEHYTTNDPAYVTTGKNNVDNIYRLVFDIGRSVGYIDEANHILNGQRDTSWDAGFYAPVSLNQMGTIVYWDFTFDTFGPSASGKPVLGTLADGTLGSPFVKAPSLQPSLKSGDTNVLAYRLVLGSDPRPDRSEQTTTTITITSAELKASGDIMSAISNAQTAIIGEVDAARNTIMGVANAIKGSTDMIPAVKSTTDSVKSDTGNLVTTTSGLVSTANTINSNTQPVPTIKTTTDSIKSDTTSLTNSVPLVLQTSPLGYVIAILAAIAALGAVASTILVSRRLRVVK